MDAARSVCPEAATLVSAGRISATSKHPTETNIVFMLDTLELYTIKRRMRAAQAKLRQDRSLDDEARRALTMQARRIRSVSANCKSQSAAWRTRSV